jgi:hypothetical protein
MAEDEIVKHTKKIYKTWFSKEFSIWHKISEFFIEIIIIVFAVSVSIWFHNRSEYAHQQQEVKSFMMGLKEDLSHDIVEMQEDKNSYHLQKAIFTYINQLKIKEPVSKDTLRKYNNWLFNTTELDPNDGRFQGFKSSGKIGTIENKELQNDIMDLYEEDIPALLGSSKMFVLIKVKFFEMFYSNLKRLTDSTTNIQAFLKTDQVYAISGSLASTEGVLARYMECENKMRKIIQEIDKEYP